MILVAMITPDFYAEQLNTGQAGSIGFDPGYDAGARARAREGESAQVSLRMIRTPRDQSFEPTVNKR